MVVARRVEDQPTVVEAFYAGSEQALAEIYARWSPLVYSVALGSLGSVADAEDVTQRVFTGAWTSRQSFDATRARLSAWLLGIARTAIAETRTAQADSAPPRTRLTTETPAAVTPEPVELTDRLVIVNEVSRLDVAPRQVLRMAMYDQLTHTEIAERTGLAPATVRSHLRRGLHLLRERLEVQTDAR